MRQLFICDTPFQVLNVLNLQWHRVLTNKEKYENADLYIVNQFPSAQSLYERIRESCIFKNVLLLRADAGRKVKNVAFRHFLGALEIVYPKRTIKQQTGMNKKRIHKNEYDCIMSSILTHFVAAMLKMNSKAIFEMIEDGTGSYIHNLAKFSHTRLYYMLSKVLKGGAALAKPTALYVNNVKMCKSPIQNILPLPEHDEDFLSFACDVFEVNKEEKYKTEIILLTQPSESNEYIYEAKNNLLKILEPFRSRITVRIHPRDEEVEAYTDYQTDDGKEIWELKLLTNECDKKVLVALYSSAQFNPKFIYDKEPWVVFAYYLIDKLPPEVKNSWDEQVLGLKNSYRNSEKVLNPKNSNEFVQQLHQLLERECQS